MINICFCSLIPKYKRQSSYLLNRNTKIYVHRCLQFWEEEKVCGSQVRWIRWLRHDYGFVFVQKLTYKHQSVSWCVIMVQIHDWFLHNSVRFWRIASRNRRITPMQYSLLTVRPFDKNSWCTKLLQSKKTIIKSFTFDMLFSVLALLDICIGMIGVWFQYHSHTPMIRHQLWPCLANLDRRWTLLNISWAMYMWCCFCSKFRNFGTIFAAAWFMPETSIKIAWHESIDMSTSSETL